MTCTFRTLFVTLGVAIVIGLTPGGPVEANDWLGGKAAVFAAPGAWLPWNYQDNLDADVPTPSLSDPPPVFGQRNRLGVAVPQ